MSESFPRWRYHKELCPDGKIVKTAEENAALGEDWVDSPAEFEQSASAPETFSQEPENAQPEPQKHIEPESQERQESFESPKEQGIFSNKKKKKKK